MMQNDPVIEWAFRVSDERGWTRRRAVKWCVKQINKGKVKVRADHVVDGDTVAKQQLIEPGNFAFSGYIKERDGSYNWVDTHPRAQVKGVGKPS